MSHLALTILEVPIILLCAYANTNTKIICIIFMYQDVCNFFLLLLFINFNDPLLGHKPNEFLQTKTNVNFFNLSLLSLLYMLKSFQNTMELSTLSTFLLHVYMQVRRQSYLEMRIFWRRWDKAVENDKCWVDQYAKSKKKCVSRPCY